jgi:hypothetical protein
MAKLIDDAIARVVNLACYSIRDSVLNSNPLRPFILCSDSSFTEASHGGVESPTWPVFASAFFR